MKKETLKKINLLEEEYNNLEQFVLDNEAEINCNKQLNRMNKIMDQIGQLATLDKKGMI